ncbi:Magnesium transport protein CorA [Novipirellula galeiformis]|uniref:Magnesium transport protein CorA n=1 Tax=Novipirellula galeiformis TaxID=2528004 RepID=A0A5C6C6H6_9BACT|nr:magnesium/cobalt transporter CorA [Novipirellula galeiformis]TWU20230.1 Magnesium transport protein CorA [Novipirellula galeiformis]
MDESQQHQPRRLHFRKHFFQPFQRRTRVGAVPGKIRSSKTATPTHVERIYFDAESLRESESVDVRSLADVSTGTQWINVVGLADHRMIEMIGERFGIHPLLLEDIVHTHQRPKVDTIQDRLVVILRMTDQQIPLHLEQVSLVLCGNTLISFQEHPGDSFEPVRRRIRQSLGRVRHNPADYLLYCLVDALLDAFFPLLEEYGRTLEKLEDDVTDSPGPIEQVQIRDAKRELTYLRKIAYGHRETIQRLIKESDSRFSEDTRLFFRDCSDHAAHILEVTESFREVVTDLRDLYFTSLSQRTNDVMRLLTLISTIFIPMSFVAGVYGMNFDSSRSEWNMPETRWQWGYPMALAMMGSMACGMLWVFYRRGWLRR